MSISNKHARLPGNSLTTKTSRNVSPKPSIGRKIQRKTPTPIKSVQSNNEKNQPSTTRTPIDISPVVIKDRIKTPISKYTGK